MSRWPWIRGSVSALPPCVCCWSRSFRIRWNPSLSSSDESLEGADGGRGDCSFGGSESALGAKNPVNFEGFDALAAVFAMLGFVPLPAVLPWSSSPFLGLSHSPKNPSKLGSTISGVSTLAFAIIALALDVVRSWLGRCSAGNKGVSCTAPLLAFIRSFHRSKSSWVRFCSFNSSSGSSSHSGSNSTFPPRFQSRSGPRAPLLSLSLPSRGFTFSEFSAPPS